MSRFGESIRIYVRTEEIIITMGMGQQQYLRNGRVTARGRLDQQHHAVVNILLFIIRFFGISIR